MIKLACVDLEQNVLTHFIIPLLNYAYIKVIPRDKMKNIMYGYANERAGLIYKCTIRVDKESETY